MATVNATLSNFFGIAELSYRGIGSGETRSYPTLPAFMQNVGKVQGVNYASTFSETVMGKGSLINTVNNYSEEKASFKSEFKNAMDNAKKTAGGLNNLNYGLKKDSSFNILNQNTINDSSAKNKSNSKTLVDKTSVFSFNDSEKLATQNIENEKTDTESKKKLTELANESRVTPPFQIKIEDDTKNDNALTATNRVVGEVSPAASDSTSVDPTKTAGVVSDLMENYNDTVGFLQSRIGTSKTFDYFASSFGTTPELTEDMDKIGVQFEPATGMVSVDTKALAGAIKDSPDSVESILGKNGFGGAVEKSSEVGNFGSDKMFPSIMESLGDKNDNVKGMYGYMRQVTSTPRGNLGNLMDMNY